MKSCNIGWIHVNYNKWNPNKGMFVLRMVDNKFLQSDEDLVESAHITKMPWQRTNQVAANGYTLSRKKIGLQNQNLLGRHATLVLSFPFVQI